MPKMKGVWFDRTLPNLTEIRDLDIPEPGDDEILVKNVAVASNPKDWKGPLVIKPDWTGVEGNDFSGIVAKVGANVTRFQPGSRVAGFTKMFTDTKYGVYAEYTVCPEHTAWQLADTTSFEDAATLPLAGTTAAIGLFRRLRLSEPPLDGSVGNAEGVVVLNGAATSVGVFIIQLVKKAGYKVVGVAGDSEELAKSLGADYVVNYRNKSPQELGKAIKEAVASTGQKIVGVFDAFSSKSSVEMIAYEVLQPEGGRITTLNPHYDNGEGLSVSNVEIDRTYVGTAYDGSDIGFAAKWYPVLGKWLDEGQLKPNKVKLMPHGLDSVQEGVFMLKEKRVSGMKLVYRIEDSLCLQQQQ